MAPLLISTHFIRFDRALSLFDDIPRRKIFFERVYKNVYGSLCWQLKHGWSRINIYILNFLLFTYLSYTSKFVNHIFTISQSWIASHYFYLLSIKQKYSRSTILDFGKVITIRIGYLRDIKRCIRETYELKINVAILWDFSIVSTYIYLSARANKPASSYLCASYHLFFLNLRRISLPWASSSDP